MPRFGPISRRDLIALLRRFDFDGPFAGGNHEFMVKGGLRLHIPNPHGGDINVPLLSKLLKQAGISKSEWESI